MQIDIETSKVMGFADFVTGMKSPRCQQAYQNDPILSEKYDMMNEAFETLQPLFTKDDKYQTGERFTSLLLQVAAGELDSNNLFSDLCNKMNEALAPDKMSKEQLDAMFTLYGAYSDFFDAHINDFGIQLDTDCLNKSKDGIETTLNQAADFLGYDIPEDYHTGALIFPMPAGFPPHGRSVENDQGSRTQFVAIPLDSRNEPEQTLITIVHEDVHKLFYDSGKSQTVEKELPSDEFSLLNEGIAVVFQDRFCDENGIKRRPYGDKTIDAEANRLEKHVNKGEKLFDENGKLSPNMKSSNQNINPIFQKALDERQA